MDNSKNKKPRLPHNGVKVNDWETLRPYAEAAKPPEDVYIEGLSDAQDFGLSSNSHNIDAAGAQNKNKR